MDLKEFRDKLKDAKPITKKALASSVKEMTDKISGQASTLYPVICMEECGELIQAISKNIRGNQTVSKKIMNDIFTN